MNFQQIHDHVARNVATVVDTQQFHSKTLDKIIELEEPNVYQEQQIYEMFYDLSARAKSYNARSKQDLIAYINSLIPDNSANFHQDTILFKHAFPESQNENPKGFFDCDARALMVLSVLEAIGKDNDIKIVDMTGHVVLIDEAKKKYYDLTLKDINIQPTQEELLLSNILLTDAEIESLIITNLATDIIENDSDNVISHKKGDENKIKEAQALLENAIKLNPKNVVAVNNLKFSQNARILEPWDFSNYDEYHNTLDQKDKIKAFYDVQILAILVANYTNNYAAKTPDLFISKEIPYLNLPENDNSSNFTKAFEGSDIVKNYTLNTVIHNLYFSKLYDKVLFLGEQITKYETLDSISGIHLFYYQLAISAVMTKQYDLYKTYSDKFYAIMKNTNNDTYKSLEYVDEALEIVNGEITSDEYHKHDLLYYFVTEGTFYNQTFDAINILEQWEGFNSFKEQVINPKKVGNDDENDY